MKRTIGTKENHTVTLSGDTFGHTNSAGLQHKGAVLLDNQETYVKLDDLNPADGREWENKFDYRYSSVSEAIVSCLTRNINSDTFKSADYHFAVFDNNGKNQQEHIQKTIWTKMKSNGFYPLATNQGQMYPSN